MATSSPEVTAIGVAQATGTVAAAAVLVYVVSLYCGAGYLDLPFETRTSKVVLGIDFESDMRACFQAFHPNARVLNMNIGLHNVVDVIRAIRELVPPGARLHLNACLPCNHSSGTSGKRKHYLTQYHVVVLYDIVQLLDPLYALTWFSENINAAAFKDPMKRLFPSAQHVVMCSSHFSCERRTRAYFASGSPIDLRALHCLKNAGGTVRSCFSLPDGVYEMKSASTKYLKHEQSWKDVNAPSPTLTTNGLYLRRRDGTVHPWLLPGWALAQLRGLRPPPTFMNVVPQRKAVSRAVTHAVSVVVARQVLT